MKSLSKVGVVGAGTMGSGIALAALYRSIEVVLQDVSPEVLERAGKYLETYLARKGLQAYLQKLTMTTELGALAGSELIIEAAVEDLAIKKEIFARLDQICPPPAILATNTSTLSVSAIAAATSVPRRVAGMHFFNPAPVLPLVEIVRGADTDQNTIQVLVQFAERLEKTPVIARDTPGFIVNRVARPFYGEALRLLGEAVADHETIDRIVHLGGGFLMGPFRLIDLIGVDVNLAAMKSMYDQTFGEPRYRPHWIQAQMVARGRLGRKTGQGFYDYPVESGQPDFQKPPIPGKESGWVLVSDGSWVPGLSDLCRQGGMQLKPKLAPDSQPVMAVVRASRREGLAELAIHFDRLLPPEIPLVCQAVDVTIAEIASWLDHPERLVGMDGLFLAPGAVVTLVPSPFLKETIRSEVERIFHGLDRTPIWVADSPGFVLPRLVSMLANEAAFAVMEGVADRETIDLAMCLGVNYPSGPIEWAEEMGLHRVVQVLDHLQTEFGEDRYRKAPLLQGWARLNQITSSR